MADAAIRTTCPYCGVGCGILATPDGAGGLAVRGDPDHPANRGRLCSKGTALGETVGPATMAGRLLHPELHGARVSWETAIGTLAEKFAGTIAQHGPDSVALYVSGQLLTEDYYVANKLMKGFVGSANIDTNSRLCMASTVAGHKRGLGTDTVPGTYEDLELADMVVLTGANLAWCHPVLYQRLIAARRERGSFVVVIDPRRTATCDQADLHLRLRPGSDVALFNWLLAFLAGTGKFAPRHASGVRLTVASAVADAPSIDEVATACDLDPAALLQFYQRFAATERVVTVFSQGVNQSVQGTDKVSAILNAHLYTGRIGRPGMGPFSVTGQPNAMGGREVGGMANMLAAHMGFAPDERDRVRRFWLAPRVAPAEGPKAVDMLRAVESGRIKALWILATNPAVSMPEAGRVRAAIGACDFVAVSDCVADTDTLRLAQLKLPALGWGEKDGTVTNSDRTISRQRAVLPAPGEARPDWWALAALGRALGHQAAFTYDGPAAIFREHAALSGFENDGSRSFDIGALAKLSDAGYDELQPAPWPRRAGSTALTPRLFGDGVFPTPDERARMVPVRTLEPAAVDPAFPLRLNTGRLRDQWHTMTRTGLSARLGAHAPEPCVDVHPRDAAALRDGGLARLHSVHGAVLARVRVTDAQRPGEAFLPMHWTERFTGGCVAGRLIEGRTDPVSGQPDLKAAMVRIEAVVPAWHGFLLSRAPIEPVEGLYWARRAIAGGQAIELAGDRPLDFDADLSLTFPGLPATAETVEYRDVARGVLRRAWLVGNRLQAALFTVAAGTLPSSAWLQQLLAEGAHDLDGGARLGLLSGRAPGPATDDGPTVCACFGVGMFRIQIAIAQAAMTTTAEIGAALRAGTNCGSCLPELRSLLQEGKRDVA